MKKQSRAATRLLHTNEVSSSMVALVIDASPCFLAISSGFAINNNSVIRHSILHSLIIEQ
jgi:hypothetical protein